VKPTRRAKTREQITEAALSPIVSGSSHRTCELVHLLVRDRERHRFPFDPALIPSDGVYLLYEKGEAGHGDLRIVRIGTHTGAGKLRSRLKEHFVTENKDRSIFRKNIGRALLARDHDPYLDVWNLDFTSSAARATNRDLLDVEHQAAVEAAVSQYIRDRFSFSTLEVREKADRLRLEASLVSIVSRCAECKPSPRWLGNHSPVERSRRSGLWQVNELFKRLDE
jgi:hypothetical protein